MKAVIYMIICLSFCSELIHCSCLSYGHSCWGAHGKRSSNVDRIESEQQPADQRWAMFKLMQDENDRMFGRDHLARLPVDDSVDYNDKRIPPNSVQSIFRNRNPPLVLLNSFNDDPIVPPEMQKLYATPNSRKRRSNAYGRNDGNNNNNINKMFATDKPQRDLSTPAAQQEQLLQQN